MEKTRLNSKHSIPFSGRTIAYRPNLVFNFLKTNVTNATFFCRLVMYFLQAFSKSSEPCFETQKNSLKLGFVF